MRFFSNEIAKLFSGLQVKSMQRVQMVPKSRSGMPPGSLIFFNYRFGGWTAVLSVSPVTKDAKTGNRLFTGFKVPLDGDYTPASLTSLYKNKELPQENYRTYVLNRIKSPVWRIR